MLNHETLQKIQDFAIAGDWNMAFAGASHGNQHLSRMVKIAMFLANQLHADKGIVEAAAWLHDVPLTSGSDYNYKRNQEVASSVLDNFSLTELEKNRIAIAVASHEGTGDIASDEAKIIHDADVLEKTAILGIIRHTWKLVHSSKSLYSDADLSEVVFKHLQWRAKQLQTNLAKNMYQYLVQGIHMSPMFMQKLVVLIRPLAEEHMITEKIAEELKQSLTKEEYGKLQEQLSLEYLKVFQKKSG